MERQKEGEGERQVVPASQSARLLEMLWVAVEVGGGSTFNIQIKTCQFHNWRKKYNNARMHCRDPRQKKGVSGDGKDSH